ncbi:MAG TPA: hypothetical protein VFV75_12530 [Candidatus Polarisedimenticolaceae bacterium]|nr:hypothetical protein [Candidatus Polarisedimenticolaceae bacterium]
MILALLLLAADPATPDVGWERLKQDVHLLATKPFQLDRAGKRQALFVAGATLGLYGLRHEIRREVQEGRSEDRSDLLQHARWMSRGAAAPVLALGAWGASFVTHDPREKETAQLLLTSAGMSAAIAGMGSFVLASERPEDGDAVHLFRTSGHGVSLDASLAASIVPPLRCQYLRVRPGDGRPARWLKRGTLALLYAGAGLTALQRIDDDKHWAPDVFLGLVNGFTVGEMLCHAREGRPPAPSPSG